MAGAPVPLRTTEPDPIILNIAELEQAGSAKMSKAARVLPNYVEFYNSGATDQQSMRENSTAFTKYRLRPRVLVDVRDVDTSTTVFGNEIAFPLCVSPAGLQKMAHPEGELATSRACAKAGVNMGISSFSNYEIEDVMAQGQGSGPGIGYALQLYMMKNRTLQEQIILRAERNGVKAIFLTGDSPVLGVRWNEVRNDFRTPKGLEFPIIELRTEQLQGDTHDGNFTVFNDDGHSWERDIPWLRSITTMQIWIKGVMTAEDTLLAIKHGVDGIIVSNHGGRQLDGVPASIDALVECVEAAEGRIPIHVDGGFRKGTDVFKALALGADCCWVGRPALWGLAYNGQQGVELMLKIIKDDFRRCMQLTGCKTIKDISKPSLALIGPSGRLSRL